jgi:hypothetical protein
MFRFNAYPIIVLLCALVISAVILAIGVVVPCRPSPNAPIMRAALYAAFDISLIVLSAVSFVNRDAILATIGRLWDEPNSNSDNRTIADLETDFGCCGWESPRPQCVLASNGTCAPLIKRRFTEYWYLLAGGLMLLAVMFVVAVAIAFRVAWVAQEEDLLERSQDGGQQTVYTDSLHSGVSIDSFRSAEGTEPSGW